MRDIPVALTLYTVRDELEKDFDGTLEKVKEIGYDNLEIGSFGAKPTRGWKAVSEDLGLKIVSDHVDLELQKQNFSQIAEFNLKIGNTNIVVPWLHEDWRQNGEDYKKIAEDLNTLGYKWAQEGVKLHYHNHSFEFREYNGKTGHQILLENTDPRYVSFQFDTYWLKDGGQDPAGYIDKYADRVGLIHLKDMMADDKKSFGEVGEGILDFKAIFEVAARSGAAWFGVEQDFCPRPSLESAKLSLENIKRLKAEVGMGRAD